MGKTRRKKLMMLLRTFFPETVQKFKYKEQEKLSGLVS